MPYSGGTVLPSQPGTKPPSFDHSSESSTSSFSDAGDYADENFATEGASSENTHLRDHIKVEDNKFVKDPEFDLSIQSTQKFVIRVPPLVSPKSSYIEYETRKEVFNEEDVLCEPIVRLEAKMRFEADNLKYDSIRNNACFGEEQFTSIKLEDFVIYRPSSGVGRGSDAEFAGLQDLCVKDAADTFYLFDGILRAENERGRSTQYYVEKVPFENLSIGGYEDMSVFSVEDTIWIQSKSGETNQVWYQLCNPAKEYKRFYEPFIWIATFAKHFLAFMDGADSGVTLHMFKSQFWEWVRSLDMNNTVFQVWAEKYSDTDFRRVVVANHAFLRNEARQISAEYLGHPIWSEVDHRALAAIPAQPKLTKSSDTVVTPLVYRSFGRMPWSKFTTQHTDKDLLPGQYTTFAHIEESELQDMPTQVFAREIVKIQRDHSGPWKTTDEIWLAFVQEVVIHDGKRALRILWLYRAGDTICSHMKYPFENELFLSNHCACDQPPIPEESIIGKAKVALWGSPSSNADFFIRQRYSDEAFESLKEEHFYCGCMTPFTFEGETGQTVLIEANSPRAPDETTIEVVKLISLPFGDQLIQVLHLARRRDFENNMMNGQLCAPNELVHTSRSMTIPVSAIIRPAHVRFFTPDEARQGRIPVPFSRGGTGDAFFITHREIAPGQALQPYPFEESMTQSFVPSSAYLKRLRTLDLFCGGGNFGRGIEEGGVATVKWAIDLNEIALHTYRANMERSDRTHLFLGSVNDYLRLALDGADNPLVAKKGEVDMILAGSPCQGFSLANNHGDNDQGLQNQSMIASVASFVDFYRPKYMIFENVKNMAAAGKKTDGQNAFCQIICTLVGMGYQVHQFCVDAWSMGSPQSRTRVFIAATAPGYVPLKNPPITHSHPAQVLSSSLGTTANGERFGTRNIDAKPVFPYVTIGEATADIELNFDGKAASIKFPDHRVAVKLNTDNRLRMGHVPRNLPKAGLGMAFRAGLIPEPLVASITPKLQAELQRKTCASFRRIHAEGLMPTVTANCKPMGQFTGKIMHWDCDRAMTVLEARRAQGFPDHEVIIGTPTQQWKIVGNSVARPVALALGMALRDAWLKYNFPNGFPKFHRGNHVDYSQPEDPAPNGYRLIKVMHKSSTTSTDSSTRVGQAAQ